MKIGISELIVIFIVALFVLGPDKLPEYAKKLGEALGQFRKYSEEATKDIKESIIEPLEEAQKPLREAVEPLEELDKAVRGNVKDVQKSFSDLGKAKPKKEEKEARPPKKEEKEENAGEKEAPQSVMSEKKAEATVEEAVAGELPDTEEKEGAPAEAALKDEPEDAGTENKEEKNEEMAV